MTCKVEVLFTPVEFRALRERDLSHTTCVVFDVLRATSTIVTALAAGAGGIIPVTGISEALALRQRQPGVLLAGEREGRRIILAGSVKFDLGNSPREFVREVVAGKLIVTTTTNGTRAFQACTGAEEIVVGAFLNLSATVNYLANRPRKRLCLVCAGTGEAAALEDTLAAGAMCDQMALLQPAVRFEDSAAIARGAFRHARNNLADALGESSNARRLLSLPELNDDVEFCIQQDAFDFVATRDPDGLLRRLP